MKISKLVTMAAVMLLAPVTMTSCLGDDNDDQMKVTTTYSSFFNSITDPATGDNVIYTGVSYILEKQLQEPKATIRMTGVKLPNGANYPSLAFIDVPWKTNSHGWTDIALTNARPDGAGGFLGAPIFTSFSFKTIDRYLSNLYVPCVSISYNIEGYQVYSFSETIIEVGKTEVTDKNTGSIFKPSDNGTDPAIYAFSLSPTTKKVTLNISGAKFHQNMPAMNMRFADIPFVIDEEGNIIMEKESLVPSMLTGASLATSTATPMPSFPITDFKAKFDPDRGLWVSYVCSPNSEKFKGVFEVSMINEYPDKVSVNPKN